MHLRIGAILLAVLSLGAVSAHGPEGQKQEKQLKPEVQVRGPILAVVPMIDFDEQYYIEQEKIAAYLAAVELQRQIDEYLAAVEAQRLADEAAAARRYIPPRASSGGNVGDCGAVAAVVGSGTVSRESGGNPLAENGIYKGCAQIGMPWWNGACAGLNWTNVADQATCAQIVMNIQGPSAWATTYGR